MLEWTICPHCSLKHGRRPDGTCPRCKRPLPGASPEADVPMPAVDGRGFPRKTRAREAAAVAETEGKPRKRFPGMIGWIMRHPPAGSVLGVVGALGTLYHGLDHAKAYRRFGKASPVAAKLASLSKTSSFPPRWNAEVSWRSFDANRSATLVVGPRGTTSNTPDLSVGTAVEILTAADNPADAMLARRLPGPPLRLRGLEIHPAGLGFSLLFVAFAVVFFVFRDKIRRDAG